MVTKREEVLLRIQALVKEQTRLETALKAVRCRYALALAEIDQELSSARDDLEKVEKEIQGL